MKILGNQWETKTKQKKKTNKQKKKRQLLQTALELVKIGLFGVGAKKKIPNGTSKNRN